MSQIPAALAADLSAKPKVHEIHAIRRARERYGLDLDMAGLRRAEEDIVAGKGLILRKTPEDGSVLIMRVGGVAVVLVVNSAGRIVTFLPSDHRMLKAGSFVRRRGKPKRKKRKP